MYASQVTNSQIEEHFSVKVINEYQAEDSKGRRKFLTDLRSQFAKEASQRAKVSQKRPTLVKQRVDDCFIELDRHFPEHNVIIRETQPGLDLEKIGLQIYVMVPAYGKFRMSITSRIFSPDELKEDFGHYRFAKKETNHDVTLQALEFDEVIEVIRQAIQLHEAAF